MSRIVKVVDADLVSRWNEILRLKKAVEGTKRDEVIERFDIVLFPGDEDETYEVEFKLVNGNEDSGPYLDVILWDDGQEVFVCDPSFERLDTEFWMRDSYMNKEFRIALETNQKVQG